MPRKQNRSSTLGQPADGNDNDENDGKSPPIKMAKKGTLFPNGIGNDGHGGANGCGWAAKSRTVAVRLISMALTGYYKTFVRPRAHRPLSMIKYDPIGIRPSLGAVLLSRSG